MAHILVIGGAHLDRRAQLREEMCLGQSHPGAWEEEAGGCGLNAASTLARLGNFVSMVGVCGADQAAEIVQCAAAQAGIDYRPQTFLDRATPSYSAILDRHGELIVGLADMALYERFGARQLARKSVRTLLAACDAVLVDTNLPQQALAALGSMVAGKPLFAIAVSPSKVTRLTGRLSAFSAVFMNAAEARMLCESTGDLVGSLRRAGLARAVVTDGARPVTAFDRQTAFSVTAPAAVDPMTVTGAGDALAAAAVDALLRGDDLPQAVRWGLAGALMALEDQRAAPRTLNRETLGAALLRVSDRVS